ncbi:MAG TPA: dipeptide epimerase [Candidatus Limnocylindrales bacterium]|nr:dipeptide epimerase [Candidatus Limnocylindrales bacterium]
MTGSTSDGLRLRSVETLHLAFRDPFRIARNLDEREAVTVIVELEDRSGRVSLGEGYPDAYYGETPETIAAVLPLLLRSLDPLGPIPDTAYEAQAWLAGAAEVFDAAIAHNGAAKCALDICLHDLAGQQLSLGLPELLGTPRELPPTDFTIGIDEPAAVARRAAAASRFPALKIKLGGPDDLPTLEQVRAVYGGPIRVDANTGWDLPAALELLPQLVRLGVELVEQPFPAHRLSDLRALQAASPLPIVADESAVVTTDLDGLAGLVGGVNVKLAKVGGVGPARRMIDRARELGFRVFLGCMEETSVGIAASAAVAGLVDWVDLDGNLLLADDPFTGLTLGHDCRWQLPTEPGLGIHRR